MRLGLVVNPIAGMGGRSIAAGRDNSVPSTIDDPTALAEIEAAIGRSVRVSSS